MLRETRVNCLLSGDWHDSSHSSLHSPIRTMTGSVLKPYFHMGAGQGGYVAQHRLRESGKWNLSIKNFAFLGHTGGLLGQQDSVLGSGR